MFVYAEVFLFGFFFVCHKFFGVVVVVIIIVVVVVVVVVVIVIIHHRYYNCIISIVPNRPLWTTWFETFVDYCLVAVFLLLSTFFFSTIQWKLLLFLLQMAIYINIKFHHHHHHQLQIQNWKGKELDKKKI